jgi:hypothetical protein
LNTPETTPPSIPTTSATAPYVSQPYIRGIVKPPIGGTVRVPAADLEETVAKAIERYQTRRSTAPVDKGSADQKITFANISRIEVRKDQLAVWLRSASKDDRDVGTDQPGVIAESPALLIPWTKPPTKRFREILLPASTARRQVRPIKFERRAALLKSIARGRVWLDAIVSGAETVEEIATRHKCSVRHVNVTISMAFIAPALVKAAIEGRLPRGIGVASLRDAPAEWSRQFERLGLPQP